MHRSWLTCALSAFVMVAVLLPHAQQPSPPPPIVPPVITVPDGAAKVEQTTPGTRPAATIVERFDGLGVGFEGPQGKANLRNPSDNTLAVGPNQRRPDRQQPHGDLHEAGEDPLRTRRD